MKAFPITIRIPAGTDAPSLVAALDAIANKISEVGYSEGTLDTCRIDRLDTDVIELIGGEVEYRIEVRR